MKLNIISVLIEFKILSFYAILYAYKMHWLDEEQIEDYSVFVIDKLKIDNEDLISLCSAKFMERYQNCDLLLLLSKKYDSLNEEEESEKLILASLITLDKKFHDEEVKLDKLQELYADLDYPGIMEYCSVYRVGNKSPLEEMHDVINSLFKKLFLK